MKRDFECMKWIGANSFRTSHYPYSDEIYQMADREGFLVIDEVPAVGLFESLMNFMEASTGKKTAFFAKDTIPELLENHLQAVEEMITRDKNHACVIAWSLLNEPETTDEAAVPYFENEVGVVPSVFLFRAPTDWNLVKLKEYLWTRGIQCTVFYGDHAFYLPLHQAMEEATVDYLYWMVRSFFDENK